VQRPKDGSDVTGFGSFDNSTCKRVLDLLEPGDLRLAQIVTKRVAVVKLGVNSGSGDGGNWLLFVVLFGPLTLLTLQQKSIGSAKLLAPIISNFQCFCCCGAIWTWRTQKKADFAKKTVYTHNYVEKVCRARCINNKKTESNSY